MILHFGVTFFILLNNFAGLKKSISWFGTIGFHFFWGGGVGRGRGDNSAWKFIFGGVCLIRNLKNFLWGEGGRVQCLHIYITVAFF